MNSSSSPAALGNVGGPIHIFHHAFGPGGGMERYAMMLGGAMKNLGRSVIFHVRKADQTMAAAMGIQIQASPVAGFPRKLQDFRFFRRVDHLRAQVDGFQIALSRVRVRDAVICGGTHRGYLARARKLTGMFDWLQIWMETEAYRSARMVISHSNLCTEELVRHYRVPTEKIVTLFPPVDARFSPARDAQQRAESRRQLGLPPDKVIFLFPSMGHSRKGLAPICEALQGFSEKLMLAVAGKPTGRASSPFLHYLGYLDDMVPAYRAADFTILGSNYEPFGLIGPESILCGTRLVFEEKIGCLAAIKPEFVFTFSVWDRESICQAAARALSLATEGRHHISRPADALRYNPSATDHAQALMMNLNRPQP